MDQHDWKGALARAYRVAFSILRNADEARDAAQESCLRAVLYLDSFDGRSPFETWVSGIAWRCALDRLRRGSPSGGGVEEIESPPSNEANPEVGAGRLELRRGLIACLSQLTLRMREIALAKYVENMSYAEIAASWGIATGTVGATIHQTMSRLQECLESRGFAPKGVH